jgi:hypothetical protein
MVRRAPQGSTIMRISIYAAILAATVPAIVEAAGVASNANFIVLITAKPSQEAAERFAQLVIERAERFRAEVAKEWLGEELSDGGIRTIISVNLSVSGNSGLTWAKDDPARKFHNVYLTTNPQKASGSILNHEIAHTVFATRFPHPRRLPPWAEEGIASRYDDESVIAVRRQEVKSWLRQGRVPRLAVILSAEAFDSFDDTQYAAAESLVSFLTTLGDKPTVVRFAEDGQKFGWNTAIRTHYRMSDLQQLQSEWQDWLRHSDM